MAETVETVRAWFPPLARMVHYASRRSSRVRHRGAIFGFLDKRNDMRLRRNGFWLVAAVISLIGLIWCGLALIPRPRSEGGSVDCDINFMYRTRYHSRLGLPFDLTCFTQLAERMDPPLEEPSDPSKEPRLVTSWGVFGASWSIAMCTSDPIDKVH